MTGALSKLILLAGVLALGACCSSGRAPEAAAPTPAPVDHGVVTEPHAGAPTPSPEVIADPAADPAGKPVPGPAIDCSTRPSRMCCKALTPECTRCADEATAELNAWVAACEGAPPTKLDCSLPPPLEPCCRAMLPKCIACADKNRAIGDAYRAQCGHD